MCFEVKSINFPYLVSVVVLVEVLKLLCSSSVVVDAAVAVASVVVTAWVTAPLGLVLVMTPRDQPWKL